MSENKVSDAQNIAETKAATLEHIMKVRDLLDKCAAKLLYYGMYHDSSKLEEPEFTTFREMTCKLKTCTYGSDEYKRYLAQMKPALDHHYANNRHHPEHFPNSVNDMTLFDLVEMLCDWIAATKRHDDGDIEKSLTINQKRFNISEQLLGVLRNTVSCLL